MMDNAIFINIYIDKLLTQVTEMTKTLLLKESQIAYLEKLNLELEERLKKSEASLEKEATKLKAVKSKEAGTF
jgi:hypothetical protein